ncbi:hypothetical protein BSNK01_13200 [Bacillaceae bacterium]
MERETIKVAATESEKLDALAVRRMVFVIERLRPWDGATGKVGRVAVLENWRGRGLGKEIMLALEKEAIKRGFTKLKLNAQCQARAFYEKLGYRPVSDVFLEAGIEHVTMEKRLSGERF